MKKISIVIVIVMLAAVFTGCGAPAPTVTQDNTANEEAPIDEAVEETQEEDFGPFNENDLTFVHEGVQYPISTPAKPLLDLFGTDFEEIVAPSCSFVGEDKQFIYDFATVYTYPMDGVDLINEVYIYGGDFVTGRGIALGDTLEMVIEAYGEGGFEDGESYVYAVGGDPDDATSPRLYFDITDGVVSGISYFGANGIVL
ncbi:MAG: hypothetical protein HN948_00465 [Clostridia bacterium]|jgi:hypothetical protein|nr:hypothetical protein [Clostridia bacterium]MBT7121460.1 hypothetical protein [Clostridia bacterium]